MNCGPKKRERGGGIVESNKSTVEEKKNTILCVVKPNKNTLEVDATACVSNNFVIEWWWFVDEEKKKTLKMVLIKTRKFQPNNCITLVGRKKQKKTRQKNNTQKTVTNLCYSCES